MVNCAGAMAARSDPLQSDRDAAARYVATALRGTGWEPDSLYVATLDAGSRESIHFWAAANETGLSFANPRVFPWTLANSPTGHIAKMLSIRGPTYTLVGKVAALVAAFSHAIDDLETGLVAQALLVAHDRSPDGSVDLAAVLLAAGSERGLEVSLARTAPSRVITADRSSRALDHVITCAFDGAAASFGSDRDGWVSFDPKPGCVANTGLR